MRNREKKRKAYLEVMRVLAVILVVYNHLPAYTLYMYSSGAKQIVTMLLAVITRINVPIFLMISGALLLDREEDFVQVCRRRITRIVVALVLAQSLLFLCRMAMAFFTHNPFNEGFLDLIRGILSGELEEAGSYWYLYAYMGMLAMLPFLQRIANKMQKQDMCMLLLIHCFFCSFIPIVNALLGVCGKEPLMISTDLSIPYAVEKAMFYPLIGYYIDHKVDIKKCSGKVWLKMAVGAFVGVLLSFLCTYYQGRTMGEYTQSYIALFDYVLAIMVFALVKHLILVRCTKLSEGKFADVATAIGRLTFGIYLLDPCIKVFLYRWFETSAETVLPTFIVSIIWCGISFLLGGIITFVLRKLPLLDRVL